MTSFLPPGPRGELRRVGARLSAAFLDRCDGLLLAVPASAAAATLAALPHGHALERARAARRGLGATVFDTEIANGRRTRVVVGLVADRASVFEQLKLAGRMVRLLAGAAPATVGLATSKAPAAMLGSLLAALRAATEAQPSLKSRPPSRWRPKRVLCAGGAAAELARSEALEGGGALARWLTTLPPNVLGPGAYRKRIAALARRHRWSMRFLGESALARLGAGAFLAVTRGSSQRDGGIVHLKYRPRGSARQAPLALIGKGLCFDTGGHNLKTAAGMLAMHTDMAGSAVVLGTLQALTELRFSQPVDAWLALAENRIGPDAYLQQEVIAAANGTTIQVVHTDAEGRLVLADTLALAARSRPAAMIDAATLTGACVAALTTRLSGVFTNRPALRATVEAAGERAGERVWTMPNPSDFDEELESTTADLRQCLIDGRGDHIYATRFLRRFVPERIPWLHVDLSSAERAGGLAHVPADITGFGVRLLATLLLDDHRALRAAAS